MKNLSRNEMKNIFGGSGTGSGPLANCSATCADGNGVSITNCQGTCSCTNNVGCTCSGSSPIIKSCKKANS